MNQAESQSTPNVSVAAPSSHSLWVSVLLNLLAWTTIVVVVARLFIGFYYSVNFDQLLLEWLPNNLSDITTSAAILALFVSVSCLGIAFSDGHGQRYP